ncbi:hypothetical protein NC652_017493 [Populus alba x Populus x berolinensis]|nr:hypothetical protein NC652_017493 [Populus alba x Populus x berolinensis]
MLCFSIPHSTCIKKIRNKTKNFSENEANRKLNIESFFLVNSAKTLGTPSAPPVSPTKALVYNIHTSAALLVSLFIYNLKDKAFLQSGSNIKKLLFAKFQSMEHSGNWASRAGRKRKLEEQDKGMLSLSLDELNEDLLERVLSWLPTSAFFRAASVCKRWKSVSDSASFKLACSEIPSREPWFLMVDPHLNQSTIFDSAERSWKKTQLSSAAQAKH